MSGRLREGTPIFVGTEFSANPGLMPLSWWRVADVENDLLYRGDHMGPETKQHRPDRRDQLRATSETVEPACRVTVRD